MPIRYMCMHAFGISNYRSGLQALDIAKPVPAAHEIVIDIKASSLSPLDRRLAHGDFSNFVTYTMPVVIGRDCAGVVSAVGSAVSSFSVGDEVIARIPDGQQGTVAEYVAVSADDAVAKPQGITMAGAASLPTSGLIAWQCLHDYCRLVKGSTVLIRNADSGDGRMAIAIAHSMGCRVIAGTVDAAPEELSSVGADQVFSERSADPLKDIERGSVDLAIDNIGEAGIIQIAPYIRRGGVIVGINGPIDPAFAKARRLNMTMRMVMKRLFKGIATAMKENGIEYHFHFTRTDARDLAAVLEQVRSGAVKPWVEKEYRFDDTVAAWGQTLGGKIVITQSV